MDRDNIEAPWIGDDDYSKQQSYTQYDYDFDHQDEERDILRDLEE